MSAATPDAIFPLEIWDGLTSTTEDVSIQKSPDAAMGNRLRAEIRSIETVLQPYIVDMAGIHAYGNPGEVLTVNTLGTGFKWAPGGRDTVELTNNGADTLVIGNAVYLKTAGDIDKAQANVANAIEFLGLVADVMIPTATGGNVQVGGFLEATTGRWDAVTGDWGGLITGSIYFLDPNTAGKITRTAPTIVDQYIIRVGQAMSATIMRIQTTIPILL